MLWPFARAGLRVTLYERDPIRAAFAEENARVWELHRQISVVQADITEAVLTADAAWLDPARRRDSRRVSDPEDYSPPLSWLTTLRASGIRRIGVKLSPAIDHAFAEQFGAELEFLSERRRMPRRRCCGSARRSRAIPYAPLSSRLTARFISPAKPTRRDSR